MSDYRAKIITKHDDDGAHSIFRYWSHARQEWVETRRELPSRVELQSLAREDRWLLAKWSMTR